MILYFSGTGNSAYAARRISAETGDKVLDLFEKIRTRDYGEICSERPWVIVSPTYAWRIPRLLKEWLEKTVLSGSREIYFVMTCGGNIGNAGKYLKKLCESKNMNYSGCFQIVMPENYIAMFSTPAKEKALRIIGQAEPEIDRAAQLIRSGKPFPERKITVIDRADSGMVNHIFYPVFVHADKFSVTERCISCGKCEQICPTNNIKTVNGKPVWGKKCTHCMACICRCPKAAIEYGKHSKGQPRYTCPK